MGTKLENGIEAGRKRGREGKGRGHGRGIGLGTILRKKETRKGQSIGGKNNPPGMILREMNLLGMNLLGMNLLAMNPLGMEIEMVEGIPKSLTSRERLGLERMLYPFLLKKPISCELNLV